MIKVLKTESLNIIDLKVKKEMTLVGPDLERAKQYIFYKIFYLFDDPILLSKTNNDNEWSTMDEIGLRHFKAKHLKEAVEKAIGGYRFQSKIEIED